MPRKAAEALRTSSNSGLTTVVCTASVPTAMGMPWQRNSIRGCVFSTSAAAGPAGAWGSPASGGAGRCGPGADRPGHGQMGLVDQTLHIQQADLAAIIGALKTPVENRFIGRFRGQSAQLVWRQGIDTHDPIGCQPQQALFPFDHHHIRGWQGLRPRLQHPPQVHHRDHHAAQRKGAQDAATLRGQRAQCPGLHHLLEVMLVQGQLHPCQVEHTHVERIGGDRAHALAAAVSSWIRGATPSASRACASADWAMLSTRLTVWVTLSRMPSRLVEAARLTSAPSLTSRDDCSISVAISLAAPALRSASLRTSAATTEKPTPWAPARAASMAALKASRLVWLAMSLITRTISPTLAELASMRSIALMDLRSESWPSSAARAVSVARSAATRVLSVTCWMLLSRLSMRWFISSARLAMLCSSWISLVMSNAYLTIFTTLPFRSRIGL